MPYATESSPLSFTHENGLKLTHLPAYSSKDLCSARDLKMICYWQSHQKKILTFLIENQQLWKLTVFSDKVLMRPTNIILQIIITLRLDVLWLKSSTLQRKRPVRYISIWPHKKKKLSVKHLLDKHLMTSGYPFRVYNTQWSICSPCSNRIIATH